MSELRDEVADIIGSGMLCLSDPADVVLRKVIEAVQADYEARVIEAVDLLQGFHPDDMNEVIQAIKGVRK